MIEIKQAPDGNFVVKSSVSDFCARWKEEEHLP
jgi:hypothetical protein